MRACLGLLVVLSLAPLRQSKAQTSLHRDPVALKAILLPCAITVSASGQTHSGRRSTAQPDR
jgi:hypothetical protein